MLAIPVLLPLFCGMILFFGSSRLENHLPENRKLLTVFVGLITGIVFLCHLANLFAPESTLILWYLKKDLPVMLHLDLLGKLFATLVCAMWLPVTMHSFEYMKHEWKNVRFYGCHLMALGVIMGICSSGNLITMYLFYEGMTLATIGYVIHTQTKEAVSAGFKYVFYSIAGAFLGLMGFFYIYTYGTTLAFTPGGVLDHSKIAGHEGILLVILFGMIVGFGSKAGMFPLHGWLSTAHPVAPAPASAILSGINTKMGVLAIIRVVYYIAGVSFLKGTWVQYAFLALTLITVFMGSMLAYKEKILKRRLAYSTVSQVSYILFGVALMKETALIGALAHVIYHSVMKNGLFLSAGSIIYKTGKTNVADLKGMGKRMPVTMCCFTLFGISMVGIPPFCGFFSKKDLCLGALCSQIPFFRYAGPIILLISALLTSGYLLVPAFHAFYQTPDGVEEGKHPDSCEANQWILIPLIFLATATIILGIWTSGLNDILINIAYFSQIFQ